MKTTLSFLDYAATFSKLIARTAKDIDVLIDSLPSEESSLELQVIIVNQLNFTATFLNFEAFCNKMSYH